MKTIQKILIPLSIGVTVLTLFALYLWFGSALIAGIFAVKFTMWQFAQVNLLFWLFGEIFKFLANIKVSK